MNASLSYLSAEQKGSLSSLPFSVLLPSELPSGWELDTFDFSEFEEGASFTVVLTKQEKRCAVATTNEGIGDAPTGVRQSSHKHPELGSLTIEHEDDGDCLSDWVEVEGGWSAVSGTRLQDADLDAIISRLVVI